MTRSFAGCRPLIAGCGLALSAPDPRALRDTVADHSRSCPICGEYAAALRSVAASRAARVTSPRRKAAGAANLKRARAALKKDRIRS